MGSAISNCLIKKSFYHIPSASCVQFPSYDLCPKGEWVVHGPTPGTAVCGPLIDCPPGEVPTLAPEGGERCSCLMELIDEEHPVIIFLPRQIAETRSSSFQRISKLMTRFVLTSFHASKIMNDLVTRKPKLKLD